MITTLPRIIFGAVLMASVGVRAHDTLAFDDTKDCSVRNLYLKDDNQQVDIEVEWRTLKPAAANQPISYKLTIKATRGNLAGKIYSLWTLGVQNPDSDVTIVSVDPNAKLLKPDETTPLTGSVPKTGKSYSNPNRRHLPHEAKICFVKFVTAAQSYAFTFRDDARGLCGFTRWADGTTGNGHDNTPPPGEPN